MASNGKQVSNENDTTILSSDFNFLRNRIQLTIKISDNEERTLEISKQEKVENVIKRAFS